MDVGRHLASLRRAVLLEAQGKDFDLIKISAGGYTRFAGLKAFSFSTSTQQFCTFE